MAVALAVAALGCSGAPRSGGGGTGAVGASRLVFSLANQDPEVPEAGFEVRVSGETFLKGTFATARQGRYLYASARFPGSEALVEVRSEAEDGVLEERKSVLLRDNTWIVVTRRRDLDGQAELSIEVSYESPKVPEGGEEEI